jgi:acetoin utilization protein AcuB
MNTGQLISTIIPSLTKEDTGDHALAMMEDNKVSQLPLVADDNYVALVQESDLLEWSDAGEHLSEGEFANFKPAIPAYTHPFEAMRVMGQMSLSVLPVLDHEGKYMGCVTRDTLFKYITDNSGIDTQGGIITLLIAPRDYTLYEIARICENEDVIIQNLQVHTTEQGMMEVTLKVNRTSISAVVASLERHNYKVTETYGEDHADEDITGKYNLLMNYINM